MLGNLRIIIDTMVLLLEDQKPTAGIFVMTGMRTDNQAHFSQHTGAVVALTTSGSEASIWLIVLLELLSDMNKINALKNKSVAVIDEDEEGTSHFDRNNYLLLLIHRMLISRCRDIRPMLLHGHFDQPNGILITYYRRDAVKVAATHAVHPYGHDIIVKALHAVMNFGSEDFTITCEFWSFLVPLQVNLTKVISQTISGTGSGFIQVTNLTLFAGLLAQTMKELLRRQATMPADMIQEEMVITTMKNLVDTMQQIVQLFFLDMATLVAEPYTSSIGCALDSWKDIVDECDGVRRKVHRNWPHLFFGINGAFGSELFFTHIKTSEQSILPAVFDVVYRCNTTAPSVASNILKFWPFLPRQMNLKETALFCFFHETDEYGEFTLAPTHGVFHSRNKCGQFSLMKHDVISIFFSVSIETLHWTYGLPVMAAHGELRWVLIDSLLLRFSPLYAQLCSFAYGLYFYLDMDVAVWGDAWSERYVDKWNGRFADNVRFVSISRYCCRTTEHSIPELINEKLRALTEWESGDSTLKSDWNFKNIGKFECMPNTAWNTYNSGIAWEYRHTLSLGSFLLDLNDTYPSRCYDATVARYARTREEVWGAMETVIDAKLLRSTFMDAPFATLSDSIYRSADLLSTTDGLFSIDNDLKLHARTYATFDLDKMTFGDDTSVHYDDDYIASFAHNVTMLSDTTCDEPAMYSTPSSQLRMVGITSEAEYVRNRLQSGCASQEYGEIPHLLEGIRPPHSSLEEIRNFLSNPLRKGSREKDLLLAIEKCKTYYGRYNQFNGTTVDEDTTLMWLETYLFNVPQLENVSVIGTAMKQMLLQHVSQFGINLPSTGTVGLDSLLELHTPTPRSIPRRRGSALKSTTSPPLQGPINQRARVHLTDATALDATVDETGVDAIDRDAARVHTDVTSDAPWVPTPADKYISDDDEWYARQPSDPHSHVRTFSISGEPLSNTTTSSFDVDNGHDLVDGDETISLPPQQPPATHLLHAYQLWQKVYIRNSRRSWTEISSGDVVTIAHFIGSSKPVDRTMRFKVWCPITRMVLYRSQVRPVTDDDVKIYPHDNGDRDSDYSDIDILHGGDEQSTVEGDIEIDGDTMGSIHSNEEHTHTRLALKVCETAMDRVQQRAYRLTTAKKNEEREITSTTPVKDTEQSYEEEEWAKLGRQEGLNDINLNGTISIYRFFLQLLYTISTPIAAYIYGKNTLTTSCRMCFEHWKSLCYSSSSWSQGQTQQLLVSDWYGLDSPLEANQAWQNTLRFICCRIVGE